MSLKGIFGFGDKGEPYYVEVEYEIGTIGRFPMYAKDGRDALLQLAKLIPTHDRIVKISFRLRGNGDTKPRPANRITAENVEGARRSIREIERAIDEYERKANLYENAQCVTCVADLDSNA